MENPDIGVLAQTLGPYCQGILRPISRPDYSGEVPFRIAANREAISTVFVLFRGKRAREKGAERSIHDIQENCKRFL
jgi:hypothetical protein